MPKKPPPEETPEETSLAPVGESALPDFAKGIDDPKELMKQNLEGRTPRLPQIKILHAGAASFQLPDETNTKEVTGVMLDQSPARAWWEKAFADSGGGNMPDCWSVDGLKPDGRAEHSQSERCATCSQNTWGSNPSGGRGKSCKEMARVHIINPLSGMAIPHRITLPPTSLRSIDEYLTLLSSSFRHMNSVVTKFECRNVKNKDGIPYTQIFMSKGGNSCKTRDEYLVIKRMVEDFRVAMRQQEVVTEEYADTDEPTFP